MTTFNKIVVAMDGSEAGASALPYAATLAKENDASLVIAHVEEWVPGKGGGPLVANETDVQAGLKARAEELTGEGTPTSVEILSSMARNPGYQIAEIAHQAGADVIVIGTRGETPLKGAVLGSVTQRLLHVADCPVLVVPPHARQASGQAAPEAAAAVS